MHHYIEKGKLRVDDITEEDFIETGLIKTTRPNLSEQDCSALFQAQKFNAALITSDNTLRKFAQTNNIEVLGHLWIFDNLVNNSIIGGKTATYKLTELCEVVNPKLGLPKIECQKRIKFWNR